MARGLRMQSFRMRYFARRLFRHSLSGSTFAPFAFRA
jgi:hypothetical protein